MILSIVFNELNLDDKNFVFNFKENSDIEYVKFSPKRNKITL